jgi:hypothetical protein
MIYYVLYNQLDNHSSGRLYPLSHSLSPFQEIYDPSSKSRRIIRCCIGERSIFKDEQSPTSQVQRLVFKNGILAVDERDVNIINFLETCDWNASNENRDSRVKKIFYKLDKEADAKENNDYLDVSFEAESIARGMSFDELLDFCRSARVNINRGAEEIKYDVFNMARNEPEYFLEMYNDPVMKRLSIIRKAEEEGFLYFDTSKRQFFFVESGKKTSIKVVPLGLEPYKAFTEWTFENDGKEVFVHIEKLLSDDSEPKVQRRTRTTTKKE